jgi:hypothetical protein
MNEGSLVYQDEGTLSLLCVFFCPAGQKKTHEELNMTGKRKSYDAAGKEARNKERLSNLCR